jgi:glucose/arabinose dehydrogenase
MTDVQQVFSGLATFTQPVALKQAPADGSRWFVVEKPGVIRSFLNDPAVSTRTTFLDISARVDSSFSESGLLGLAFHPSWPGTPEIFVSYTVTGPGSGFPLTSRISRFTSLDNGMTVDPASEEILLTLNQDNNNHNGGDIAFGPNGLLFAGFGDGGGGGDPNENAQNTQNLLGTIIRIDVDGNAPYEIPLGNPFAGNSACTTGVGGADCPEIFAWGLRNPWRFSFDSATGTLWAADVGQQAWEEVNRVALGQNYGWNDREGAHCFDPPSGCSTNSIDPITEYARALGQSITGGYVYRGSAIADLVGWYVFADYVTGRVFAVPESSQPTVAPNEIDDTSLLISAFAEDIDGELYLLSYTGGTIYRLIDAP